MSTEAMYLEDNHLILRFFEDILEIVLKSLNHHKLQS